MARDNTLPVAPGPRRSIDLDGAEALRLLGSVSFGRIVFTQHALPTIRPVNHVLDDGDIVIRTHEGAALTSRARNASAPGVVVAYEADAIDPDTHLGWSVVVTGYAHLVTDARDLARYQDLLHPWVGQAMDYSGPDPPRPGHRSPARARRGVIRRPRSVVRHHRDRCGRAMEHFVRHGADVWSDNA